MKQNKSREQTLESAQNGMEITFNVLSLTQYLTQKQYDVQTIRTKYEWEHWTKRLCKN